MPPSNPRWLDIVQHRVRGVRVPYLLVVQHDAIPATTRLVAPVTRSLPSDVGVLAPRLLVNGEAYRARLLDLSAVAVTLLGDAVASAEVERDAILDAIDIILHGYPVGRPL